MGCVSSICTSKAVDENYTAEKTKLLEQNKTLKKELKKAKHELENLHNIHKNVESEKENLERQTLALQETINYLEKDLDEQNSSQKSNRKEIRIMQGTLHGKEMDLKTIEITLKEKEAQIKVKEVQFMKLEKSQNILLRESKWRKEKEKLKKDFSYEFESWLCNTSWKSDYEIDEKLDELIDEFGIDAPDFCTRLAEYARCTREKENKYLTNYVLASILTKCRISKVLAKTKRITKHVLFVQNKTTCWLSWSDYATSYDPHRATITNIIDTNGIQLDWLDDDELERLIVIQTEEGKHLFFLADSIEQSRRWVAEVKPFLQQINGENLPQLQPFVSPTRKTIFTSPFRINCHQMEEMNE